MAEVHFDRFEREAERLLADLQSNGDIQITGPEESVLKLTMIIVASRARTKASLQLLREPRRALHAQIDPPRANAPAGHRGWGFF